MLLPIRLTNRSQLDLVIHDQQCCSCCPFTYCWLLLLLLLSLLLFLLVVAVVAIVESLDFSIAAFGFQSSQQCQQYKIDKKSAIATRSNRAAVTEIATALGPNQKQTVNYRRICNNSNSNNMKSNSNNNNNNNNSHNQNNSAGNPEAKATGNQDHDQTSAAK